MGIEDIKTPEDILEFMKANIRYGWLDIFGEEHIGNMKNFRRLYRTSSIKETLNHGMGICIEQVYLMSMLLNMLNIPNRMYCARIYEGEDFNDLDAREHMHCFVLYELNGKVYQIEHPNMMRIGIYEYDSYEAGIEAMKDYYTKMSLGKARQITQFYDVESGMSFKDFNLYINGLDQGEPSKKK